MGVMVDTMGVMVDTMDTMDTMGCYDGYFGCYDGYYGCYDGYYGCHGVRWMAGGQRTDGQKVDRVDGRGQGGRYVGWMVGGSITLARLVQQRELPLAHAHRVHMAPLQPLGLRAK
eukprot:7886594-Pyramimonas_sp.AAC.1